MDRSHDTIAPLGPEGRILKAALAVVAVERSQQDNRHHTDRRSDAVPDRVSFPSLNILLYARTAIFWVVMVIRDSEYEAPDVVPGPGCRLL